MKKYIVTAIVVVALAALGLGYYFYTANKTPASDATDTAASSSNSEVATLTSRDLSLNYPESPRDLIKLYARITKAYYATELTADEITALGKQARLLFDDELLASQTEKDFFEKLNEEISAYRSANMYISDYKIESAANVNYTTFKERNYASIKLVYYIREDSTLHNSYTKFTLRKDSSGHWKILYWELVDETVIE